MYEIIKERLIGPRTGKRLLDRYRASSFSSLAQASDSDRLGWTNWYVVVGILAAMPALWMMHVFPIGSLTGDAVASYLAAKTFAATGSFAFSDGLTLSGASGPTTFWLYPVVGGKAVPSYPLGHLLLLGINMKLFGPLAPYTLALIPAFTFVGLAAIVRTLAPEYPKWALVTVLATTPLWYWSVQPYLSGSWSLLFLVWAIYWFIRAAQTHRSAHANLTFIFLALVSFVRFQEAPAMLLLGGVAIAAFRDGAPLRSATVRNLALRYSAIQLALFVIPFLTLNKLTYGSPFSTGYTVLFTDIVPKNHNVLISLIKWAIFPWFPTPFSLTTTFINMVFHIVVLIPLIATLAMASLIASLREIRNALSKPGVILLLVAAIYILISRSNPETFSANETSATLNVSVIRYWYPVFVALAIGAAFALKFLPQPFLTLCVGVLLVSSVATMFYSDPKSVSSLISDMRLSQTYRNVLLQDTEQNAVVIAGALTDKFSAPVRRTVSWRQDTGTQTYTTNEIASVAGISTNLGRPTYFITGTAERDSGIQDALASIGLGLSDVANMTNSIELQRVIQLPRTEALTQSTPGTFVSSSSFTPPLSLTVMDDGNRTNLVTNPSFEEQLAPWGPAYTDGSITRSNAQASEGRWSLRMERQPGTSGATRQNLVVPRSSIPGDSFSVSVNAYVQSLTNARAQLNVYAQDSSHKLIKTFAAGIDAPTQQFVPLSLQDVTIPPGTYELVVQLLVNPASADSSAVVYWDGVVLTDNVYSDGYFDGSTDGCTWAGAAQSSISQCQGAINSFAWVADGQRFVIKGLFKVGDKIHIGSNGMVATRDSVDVAQAYSAVDFQKLGSGTVEMQSAQQPTIKVSFDQ